MALDGKYPDGLFLRGKAGENDGEDFLARIRKPSTCRGKANGTWDKGRQSRFSRSSAGDKLRQTYATPHAYTSSS